MHPRTRAVEPQGRALTALYAPRLAPPHTTHGPSPRLADYQLVHRGGRNADPHELRSLFYITFGRNWFQEDNFKFDDAPLLPARVTSAAALVAWLAQQEARGGWCEGWPQDFCACRKATRLGRGSVGGGGGDAERPQAAPTHPKRAASAPRRSAPASRARLWPAALLRTPARRSHRRQAQELAREPAAPELERMMRHARYAQPAGMSADSAAELLVRDDEDDEDGDIPLERLRLPPIPYSTLVRHVLEYLPGSPGEVGWVLLQILWPLLVGGAMLGLGVPASLGLPSILVCVSVGIVWTASSE